MSDTINKGTNNIDQTNLFESQAKLFVETLFNQRNIFGSNVLITVLVNEHGCHIAEVRNEEYVLTGAISSADSVSIDKPDMIG